MKNSGDSQRAKRLCGWRAMPGERWEGVGQTQGAAAGDGSVLRNGNL